MNRIEVLPGNLSIARIEEKCINCGMCLNTCKSINNIGSDCINCGQCILTCPSGALIPKYDYQKVLNYLNDTEYTVVVFTSPAVRVAIGDEFGFNPGTFLEKKMVGALKSLGFDYVFDTTFGADLTVMEEANELVERINNKKIPLFTSCCPSWVEFIKHHHPEDINLLSSCKSPIAMEAAMIKSYFADMYELDKEKIIAVALTPCVSKKTEKSIYPETDFVITTRELVMMIREMGIDFSNVAEMEFDKLLGKGSGGGLIFGVSGGVTEACLRTAYYMINRKKAPEEFYCLKELRDEQDLKVSEVDMGEFKLKVAVANKISTVIKNYEFLKSCDFVEVMSCPGGCIGGAGQPLSAIKDMKEIRSERINSMYYAEKETQVKESYMNSEIQDAYISYISKNNVELHTKHHIVKEEKVKE